MPVCTPIHTSILCPDHAGLVTAAARLTFKIGKCEPSNSVFSPDCSDYSGSLASLYKFQDQIPAKILVKKKKKNSWDFDRNCVESLNQFGDSILTVLSPLIYENRVSFHVFSQVFFNSTIVSSFQYTSLIHLLNIFLSSLLLLENSF